MHDWTFSTHTFNCVCHSIRSMFRVLGIYNFAHKMVDEIEFWISFQQLVWEFSAIYHLVASMWHLNLKIKCDTIIFYLETEFHFSVERKIIVCCLHAKLYGELTKKFPFRHSTRPFSLLLLPFTAVDKTICQN